jgi:outer membrane protein assembly factor BamD (BamD/ComL family)
MAEMQRGRYYKAYEWFERQLDAYPSGVYSDRALQREYEIADAFLEGRKRRALGVFRLDATDEALTMLRRLAEHAPGTQLAADALLRVADHYFDQGQWEEATQGYDQYLALFGETDLAPYAMLQGARSAHNAYRGKAWDDTPLIEAEQRYRAFRELYPVQAERADVAETLQQIDRQQAAKLAYAGDLYQRIGREEAAGYYDRLIAEKFPFTPAGRGVRQAHQPPSQLPEERSPRNAELTEPAPLGADEESQGTSPTQPANQEPTPVESILDIPMESE